MSFEFAYRFRSDAPPSDLRDLDVVVLTADATSDDGAVFKAGSEGTIVSVFRDGEAYVVEFEEPVGALATVLPGALKLIARVEP